MEEFLGDIQLAQSERQAPEIIGNFGVIWEGLQGCFIAFDRTAEVSGLFSRHGERIPGNTGSLILIQGFEGPVFGSANIAPIERGNRAIQ